jgi:putative N6-adenine-specific DNA methylase
VKQVEYTITTIPGLESEASKEISNLNGKVLNEGSGFVRFTIHPFEIPNILSQSRVILRVLEPIIEGEYTSLKELIHRCSLIDWSRFLQPKNTFKIDLVGRTALAANQYMVLAVKDVLVDSLKRKYGIRPSIDTRNPDQLFILFVNNTHCTIYRDAAGVPLNQRGYRTKSLEAPINEVIAAGLLSFLGWNGTGLFIDPMCGSGTIPLEALSKSMNLYSQIHRTKGFALDRWPDRKNYGLKQGTTTGKLNQTLSQQSILLSNPKPWRIIGADKNPDVKPIVAHNITQLLTPYDIKQPDDFSLEIEHFEYLHANPVVKEARLWAQKNDLPTMVCFNPPYDQRMAVEDIREFYKFIGDTLKQQWKHSLVGIISGSVEGIKHIGLRAQRKIHIKNGPIDTRFHIFSIH